MACPHPYRLLTSLRFDPFLSDLSWNNDNAGPSSFLLLPFHHDRLITAADRHGWHAAKFSLTYDALKDACQNAVADSHEGNGSSVAFKVRVLLSESGLIEVLVVPIKPLTAEPTWLSSFDPKSDTTVPPSDITQLYVDSQPTGPSLFTTTKTTERTVYDDARLRVALPPFPDMKADVLMFNAQGLITETSIFNVAFRRSSQWLTPKSSVGSVPGVFRRWLLENGRVYEDTTNVLTKDNVRSGEWVLLFNGVQGCRLGKIQM